MSIFVVERIVVVRVEVLLDVCAGRVLVPVVIRREVIPCTFTVLAATIIAIRIIVMMGLLGLGLCNGSCVGVIGDSFRGCFRFPSIGKCFGFSVRFRFVNSYSVGC